MYEVAWFIVFLEKEGHFNQALIRTLWIITTQTPVPLINTSQIFKKYLNFKNTLKMFINQQITIFLFHPNCFSIKSYSQS